MLWREIEGKQILGHAFERRHAIGRDVVDFYCSRLKLAIEVDAIIRDVRALQMDKRRLARLESRGIVVLHYSEDEILHNLDGVVAGIRRSVRNQPDKWGAGRAGAPTGVPASRASR